MLAPITAVTTARTAQLDMSGVDYATIIVSAGVELNTNNTNVVITLAHGDDGTNYTTLSTTTMDNTAASKQEYHVCNDGSKKKYLKVTLTPDTTTNGPILTSVLGVTVRDTLSATSGTLA